VNTGDLLVLVYGNKWVVAILALMALNVAAGIVVSLYLKQFYLASTADFLVSRALPYVGVAGILHAILIVVPGEFIPDSIRPLTAGAIWGAVIIALVGHILDTLNKLPFVNLPSFLTDRPTKPDVSAGT
jgi:hypothetical protein